METDKVSNPKVVEDQLKLRDELAARAFDENGYVIIATLAEVVYKINSCLFRGYK